MLYSLLAALSGSILFPQFKTRFWIFAAIRFVLLFIIGGLVLYFSHPVWQNKFGWYGFFGYVLLGTVMQLVFIAITEGEESSIAQIIGCFVGVLVSFCVFLFGYAIQPSAVMKATYKNADVTISSKPLPSINGNDIPIVPYSTALSLAQNSLQKYGQQYEVSSVDIERYHGKLYWVGAIDYQGWSTWRNTGEKTPGYVMVSATNPNDSPILHVGVKYHLRYTPNASYGNNLYRLLNFHFPQYPVGNADLEINPEGKPYWVASLYRLHTNPYLEGSDVIGTALVNPWTGSIHFYPAGKQPAWVSQVVGANFVKTKLSAWGRDKNGWWSMSWFGGHPDAMQPVDTPIGVVGADHRLYWYTGMTSLSAQDKSLIGYVMTDAETGHSTFYPTSGLQNGAAAISRVSGAVQNPDLSALQPVFYNLYGHPAFISPVVNQSGMITDVAIIDPSNSAPPIIGSTMADALSGWQQYIASGAGSGTVQSSSRLKTVAGQISYLDQAESGGNTLWYFTLKGNVTKFSAAIAADNELPFLRVGDKVVIKYVSVPGVAVNSVRSMN